MLPIAAFMLLGGVFVGVVRAWAAGCLAVVLWYERLPVSEAEGFDPFDAFGLARLRLRVEHIDVRNGRGGRVLLVSDLHLGRPWNRRLRRDVLRLARRTRPDVILVAGDVADRPAGVDAFKRLLPRLASVAPVAVLPGNHDRDESALREAVIRHGGHWLPDGPLVAAGVVLATPGAAIEPRADDASARVLCVHRPAMFDRVDCSAYRVLLAGHLHGGQCVLGVWRGRLLPAWLIHDWHVDRSDAAGRTHVISRGAGDTLPLRFNCPREVVLVSIGPQAS